MFMSNKKYVIDDGETSTIFPAVYQTVHGDFVVSIYHISIISINGLDSDRVAVLQCNWPI